MEMANESGTLRKRTLHSFPLTPLPEVKLQDAVLRDDWGHAPKEWPVESWRNWTEIPIDLLKSAECLLDYFDGPDLTYFLPRFIFALLDEAEYSPIQFSIATESFVYHLTRWRKKNYSGIALTGDQKDLLEDVFSFAKNIPDLLPTIQADD